MQEQAIVNRDYRESSLEGLTLGYTSAVRQ